jgi:hypothetical protein
MANEFQPLADDLFWRRIERSRLLSPEARMQAGPELFDYACSISLAGLREQRPTNTEAELLAELRRRIKLKRQLEEAAT